MSPHTNEELEESRNYLTLNSANLSDAYNIDETIFHLCRLLFSVDRKIDEILKKENK